MSDIMNGVKHVHIVDKAECCGCAACSAICPKRAISMVEDEEGFLYPHVDESKCVECSLCLTVCPFRAKVEEPRINDSGEEMIHEE